MKLPNLSSSKWDLSSKLKVQHAIKNLSTGVLFINLAVKTFNEVSPSQSRLS